MRKALRVLFYLLAAEVIVQGAAIAYGLAGFGKWIDDGHTANKALFENENAKFGGDTGFGIHFMNGMLVIPVLVLVVLIVTLFAKVAGATRSAAILLGLVILQVALGLFSHAVPALILLHVPNAFLIFTFAAVTAWRLGNGVVVEAPRETASV